jgi:hypothetical protein
VDAKIKDKCTSDTAYMFMQLECRLLEKQIGKDNSEVWVSQKKNILLGYCIVFIALLMTFIWSRLIWQLEILNEEEAQDFDDDNVTASDFTVSIVIGDQVYQKYKSAKQNPNDEFNKFNEQWLLNHDEPIATFSQYIQAKLKW